LAGLPIMLVGVLVIDAPEQVSVDLKPLPEIDTLSPALTKVGLSVIVGVGLVTVNVAEAESPVLPLTLMEYAPNTPVLALKEPDMEPLAEKVHVAAVTIDDGVLVTQG